MKKSKRIILLIVSASLIFVILFCVLKYKKMYDVEFFISQIEGNSILNKENKSEILEFYTDPEISDKEKKELAEYVKMASEWFTEKIDFENEVSIFSDFKSDYDVVLQEVISYMKNVQYCEPYCVIIYEENGRAFIKGTSIYEENCESFEVSISVYESMQRIEEAFEKMGYPFRIIRIQNNSVCFDTVWAEYAIVYSIDDIPLDEKGMDVVGEKNYFTGKITDNWYYRFLK